MFEQRNGWLTVLRRLVFELFACALVPVVFLGCYLRIFGAPESSIAPHMYVFLSLVAGMAGLRIGVALIPIGNRNRLALSALLVTVVGLITLTFYGLVFAGLTHWKRVTTFDMASSYALQIPELLRVLGYSPLPAAISFFLLFVVCWLINYFLVKKSDWITPLSQQTSKSARGLISFGLLAISLTSAIALQDREWGILGEPLSLSLFPVQGQKVMQSHAIDVFHSAELDRQENAVRAAYRPGDKAKHSNVILIVSDALRYDHLSLFGYPRKTSPNLENLRETGHQIFSSSAVAVCNESSCGLRGLASSRYVDRQATNPITLHEILKAHGYRIHLIFSGDHTNFDGLSEIYCKVDSYFDGASQAQMYLNDDRLVTSNLRKFKHWDGHPTMFQFHLMSSHALGQRFDDTPEFGPGENYTAIRWGSKSADAPQRAKNFYDRGILQSDRIVHEILQLLDERGYLQDALVVITGDHGESLGERGLYSHTHSVWEEALRVPLIFLQFGTSDYKKLTANSVISQVDVAPTLLDYLEMPIPSSWEGLPLQTATRAREIYFQQAQFVGLIDGREAGKIYKHWLDTRKTQQFTFDLVKDPGEIENSTNETSSALLEKWHQLLAGRSAALAPTVNNRLEPKTP